MKTKQRKPQKSVIKFMAEFTRNWQRTGALFPASRRVAEEMAACIPKATSSTPGRRILEVGGGTGAITSEVLQKMSKNDSLVVYELSPDFAHILLKRIEHELDWQGKNIEIRIAAFPDHTEGEHYDFALCSLPINNFSSTLVKQTLSVFTRLLAGGGKLSLYEYWMMRKVKMTVTNKEREFLRLKRIDRMMQNFMEKHRISEKVIKLSLPPAWVHVLKFK